MKIIIAVVAVILLAIVGAFALLSSTDITLVGTGAQVTVPANYTLDTTKATASNDDVIIVFNGIIGNVNEVTDFYKAISANGKSSGYQNITEDTINRFKDEYDADSNNLTLVKYGSSTEWTEYTPENITEGNGSIDTDHYRKVYYISPNNAIANILLLLQKIME